MEKYRCLKKWFLFAIVILFFETVSIQAQNKLGNNPTVIQSGSLLELESLTKGLRLPRILLNDVHTWTLDGMAVSGMLICNDAGSEPKGIYYWNTDLTQWVRIADKLELISTGFLDPTAMYQAVSPATSFPTSSSSYPGSGNVTFTNNEAIKLVYTVTGIQLGETVTATTSSSFDDKLIIAKTKITGLNTVEVLVINGTASTIVPANLQMAFSFIQQ
jgi:hypothetical protein